jgi:mRNA interferase RelE/StbE
MTWKIDFSKKAFSFAEKQNIYDKTIDEIKNFIRKTKGEDINIDIKRLTGNWKGFYRIRKGKIRIIFTINYESKQLYVDKIDFRGDVYK